MDVKRRRQILLDCLLLFLCAATLVRPYFINKYTDQWPSIESTFISDARFLVAHWPHPQWQPLWYGGTRFDYIYPPALRYGTAIVSMATGFWPVKAYHFYTMFFYCLGIVGVYFLMRAAGRARGFAFLGAAATALMSSALLFMKDLRLDSQHLVPVRLTVLLRYGEGPHIAALALIPFALAFTWLALDRRRPAWIALAAIACAAVVSTNFYGATALAMFYAILVWSFWITRRHSKFVTIAIAIPIPLLAYGLTAFWLVPSYLRITAHNMQYLPEHGNMWSLWVAIVVAVAFMVAVGRQALNRPQRTWAVFVIGCVFFFSLDVLGKYYFGFNVAGDPHRLVPELDLALVLGAALLLEWLWNRRRRAARLAVCVIFAAALATTTGYIRHAWHVVARWPDYHTRVEYRVTDWLWTHMPDARVCTGGTVRFWFDAWHDLAELGGGSEQGLLNPVVQDVQWEIGNGTDPAVVLLWLRALGVDAIYFAGPNSEEPYKDFNRPERFAAVPLLFDDGRGNVLYGIPRRYAARARVVESTRLSAQHPPRDIQDLERLRAYVDVVENGPDSPAALERSGTDAMVVSAKLDPGQSVLVQETFDPAWQAWSNGKRLPLRKDVMGFILVDAPPGEHEIRLVFVTPLENRVGRALTAISVLLLVWLFIRRERAR
jgi:hypothetical protein